MSLRPALAKSQVQDSLGYIMRLCHREKEGGGQWREREEGADLTVRTLESPCPRLPMSAQNRRSSPEV